MTLHEIIYNQEDHNKGRVWCLDDDTMPEYTVCGNPIPEGETEIGKEYEDEYNKTTYKVIGKIKNKGKITCPDCRARVKWFKQLPKNCL